MFNFEIKKGVPNIFRIGSPQNSSPFHNLWKFRKTVKNTSKPCKHIEISSMANNLGPSNWNTDEIQNVVGDDPI